MDHSYQTHKTLTFGKRFEKKREIKSEGLKSQKKGDINPRNPYNYMILPPGKLRNLDSRGAPVSCGASPGTAAAAAPGRARPAKSRLPLASKFGRFRGPVSTREYDNPKLMLGSLAPTTR